MQMQEYSEQVYFAQQFQQVNQIYIKTSYGNIFAHAVGQHGQPLIIVVHGSGPKNSADSYLYLLHEYLIRVSYIQKFFIIAIDCPGYGRSKGSKQAVKTFPLQMFKQILKDLGYNSYFAMLGHSQGGAAIFNAVYEDPKLTQFLLMDRPVCGNIKRFSKFPIPTLLIYDIQDDGHPIWQGKLLFKQLLSSQFHSYRDSQDTFWVPDNIWNLIIAFFKRYSTTRKSLFTSSSTRYPLAYRSESNRKNQQKSQKKSKPKNKNKSISMSKCEQIKKQREVSEKSLMPIKQINKSQLHSKVADLEEFQDLPTWLNQPKIEQTQEQIIEQQRLKKRKQQKLKEKLKSEQIQASSPIKKQKLSQQTDYKVIEKQQKQNASEQQKQKITKQQKQVNNDIENENRCSICHQLYFHPYITNCKHIFCKKCLGQSMLVDTRCPLCRTVITNKSQKNALHETIFGQLSDKDKIRRQKQLTNFQTLLKSIVYIEIGNNSKELPCKKSAFTKTKPKFIWQLYVKQPKNFKLQQVSFNINMGQRDAKPIKVTHAPFTFESRGTFSFSCEITIKPKSRQYAPITSVYRIDVTPGNHSKIIALKKKI